MAATKPKKNTAKTKSKTSAAKTKAASKSTKVAEKPVVKAAEKKVEKVETVEKTEKEEKKVVKQKCFKAVVKDFFAKKCDPSENILTIFHNKKIYAALIAEILGTMVLSIVLLTLGLYQPLYIFFIIIAITLVMFKLSGSNFNPLITVGMMASRRMSAIRGVLYILAQIVGAWLGLIIVNAFRTAGSEGAELPAMTAIAEGGFWTTALLEMMGAAIIGFFFAKAQQYRRSSLTFAVAAAGGVMISFVVIYLISYTYFGLTNNFMMNPAVALMYQILPSSGDTFGALMGEMVISLLAYVIFPMLGGVIGFYLSDITAKLNDEDLQA